MDSLFRDFRLAIRSLLRVPGFTIVAVLTLAVGLGTTTLMFTTANAAFLQPVGFEIDGLARVWQVSRQHPNVRIAPQLWRDWSRGLTSASSVAASAGAGGMNVSAGADAERVTVASVSRNFLATLGVRPILGRSFSEEEAVPNGPVAVIISHQLWERFFGRAPDVLSRKVLVEGTAVPIIGVLPAGFSYPQNADLWATFERQPESGRSRTAHEYEVIARLAPGASIQSLQAELESFTRSLHAEDAEMRAEGHGVRAVGMRDDLLEGSLRPVTLLLGAVVCLLLIACANVVNLLLARSVSRRAQTTLRIALGASRADIIRVFVMESLVLSIAGGALGAILMVWAGDLATGLIPPTFRQGSALEPDLSVFAMLSGLVFLVGVACGVGPARTASGVDLKAALASGSQTMASEPRAMRVMVAIEVALGVVLLVGAGLLIASLSRLENVDPGFTAEGVSLVNFNLGGAPGSAYTDAGARARFYDDLLDRTAAIPGITAAGVTSSFPFTFSPNAGLEEEATPASSFDSRPATHYRVVGGRYFEALGVPLRAGRLFTPSDRAGTPHVAIVNETTARLLWNGASPVGRRVRIASVDRVQEFATVVGVVADMRHRGLTEPVVSEIYFPYQQRPFRTFAMTLVSKSDAHQASVAAALRQIVKSIDPAVPAQPASLTARLEGQLRGARFRTRLFTGFAATALALAAFGIFGVVSYTVAARTREMGIRLALGARAGQVRQLVLRRAMSPVLIGLAIGMTVAAFASRLLQDLLFGIERTDPAAYVAAALLLLGVATAAAWWPAHRATRVDPLATLRTE